MAKPLPRTTPETRPYWDGAAAGELRFTQCVACAKPFFPPRDHCPACGGGTEWRTSSGRGTIHSATHVMRAPTEAFRADVPYYLALIDLDEGFRIMTNVRGGDAAIGDTVSIIFETVAGGVNLPQAAVCRG